ncbi:DUF3017 domain-containing protein [Nocardioides sp. LML1-1-1.1]|uniref:DUF3017 domain-containing protein n=1 Tax=Nocardioides sp. LML1-1-1.1 TaxID=3135248 RepID=UPI0034259867
MGLAEPGWRRSDDPRHAAGQRGRDGREERGREGSALNEQPQVPGEDDEEPLGPRRYPSTIGGAFYIGILLIILTGLVVASLSEWRTGLRIVSAGLGLAAALRLVLPDRDAGMLAVRHRVLDVALLVILAVALFVLVATIPEQPV